MAANKS
ncbi:uncharacterized protein FFC1_08631 [Fusarium fujikuroi]|nr:uncharacterized protein FFC1_08631 [Fusarium fujikuroi]